MVFNDLEAEQDVRELIDAVRLARTLAGQAAWDRYRREELTPGPDVTSDREIEAFLRRAVSTSYHPSGSCRMGADAEAVVDGEGRRNALRGVRVADFGARSRCRPPMRRTTGPSGLSAI